MSSDDRNSRNWHAQRPADRPHTPFSRAVGRSRFIVLLAVVAVMLVAVSLFLMGVVQAAASVWEAWVALFAGELHASELTVEFLEIVAIMLKAVVFYIIGVGLYSLFITPLNLTVSLGVENLNDLESKVVSIVIVIMSVTFLEQFIRWEDPLATLEFGVAFAVVVAALVFFQNYNHRVREDQVLHHPDVQARAQKELFEGKVVEHEVHPDQIQGLSKEDADEDGAGVDSRKK